MAIRAPIIILGNQKSGTTAIASLLADYGNMAKTLDIPELWACEQGLHAGTISFRSFVESHPERFSTQVVKEPCLTFLFEQCFGVYPLSPYIFIIRHPVDNIRSILDRLKIPCDRDSVNLSDYEMNETWSYVMNGKLLNIGHEHYIARLAMRWVAASEVFLKHKDKMLLVRYEDFIENKFACIQRIAEKMGIQEAGNIQPLLNIQYQPRGDNREAALAGLFGERNLRIIYDVCHRQMEQFQYGLLGTSRHHVGC